MKRFLLVVILTACLTACAVARAQESQVTLQFSAAEMRVDETSVVDVLINCNIDSCAAADLAIQYDPEMLQVNSVRLGDYPSLTGNTPLILENRIDPELGNIVFRYITLGRGDPGSSGSGVMLHMSVKALKEGQPELYFTQAKIASQDGQITDSAVISGTVDVLPRPTPQTIIVEAEAGDPEQITVSELDTNNAILSTRFAGRFLMIDVDPTRNSGLSLVITSPRHLACLVTGNQDRQIILRAGDVNGDGIIDIQDASIIGAGEMQGDQMQNDLNQDAAVNIYDLILIGRNYGARSGEC